MSFPVIIPSLDVQDTMLELPGVDERSKVLELGEEGLA